MPSSELYTSLTVDFPIVSEPTFEELAAMGEGQACSSSLDVPVTARVRSTSCSSKASEISDDGEPAPANAERLSARQNHSTQSAFCSIS
ncbi:hypothetical protein NMY22_g4273 [Coprinellus aureogranulatus]|nr:hypothetical protein NMY22_g4273 [Coprinellus aureogranulatus]